MFCSYFISLSTQGYRLPCVQLLRTLGPYQNYLLNANNQKNSIFFRPLFSALVALLRFACLSRRIGTAESLNSVCASVSCRNWEKSDHAIYFEKNLVKSKCFPKLQISFAALTSFCLCQESNECSVNHRSVIIRWRKIYYWKNSW